MSMMGNIAIAGYIKEILKWLEENHDPEQPHVVLIELKEKLKKDLEDAENGWL